MWTFKHHHQNDSQLIRKLKSYNLQEQTYSFIVRTSQVAQIEEIYM